MRKWAYIWWSFCIVPWTVPAAALERGAILYHTSDNGIIYGKTDDLKLPCSVIKAVLGDIDSGHVGIYIGDLKIVHAVLSGIEETDSASFIPADALGRGVAYLGAKLPVNYDDPDVWNDVMKDQIVLIAKEQVGKGYDILFHKQTGPDSGDFTCVGLAEYVYQQVGYTITPLGYYSGGPEGKSFTQTYNCESTLWRDWQGVNTFAYDVQFSMFNHPLDACCGKEYEGEKYLFFPYTQFLQKSTIPVVTDIPISGETASGDGGSGGCFIESIIPIGN